MKALIAALLILAQAAAAEVIRESVRPPANVLVVMFMAKGEVQWRISEERGPLACEAKARNARKGRGVVAQCFEVRASNGA